MNKLDRLSLFFILIISLILVSDLFINRGAPATFDGPTHLANIAMFHRALSDGEVRPSWGDGFANYGMPMPLYVQQVPSYLGGVLTFVTGDVVTSYKLVFLIGTLLSSAFFYLFLRRHFAVWSALGATILFNFAPYRIINMYIRGALPEYFAAVFLPLILLGINDIIGVHRKRGFIILTVSIAGLILTHPFTFVIYAFIFVPYTVYLLVNHRYVYPHQKEKRMPLWQYVRENGLVVLFVALCLGMGLSLYYLIPLFAEIKYFYYGLSESHLQQSDFLGLRNYFDPLWYYNFKNDIYTRGHFIKADLLETVIIGIGFIIAVARFVRRRKIDWYAVMTLMAIILVIFMTGPYSRLLYEYIPLLGGIQRPWRMLSALIFLVPMLYAYMVEGKSKWSAVIPILILLILFRFPQIYGKNYMVAPQRSYYVTVENLHGTILNTIWTSKTQDYPVQKTKVGIFEGKGKVTKSTVKNSWREYTVDAQTDIKMVDYTFYFPGWRVFVDGKKTDIQFQDPSYRGVITYQVPKGVHTIAVTFGNTSIRLISSIISLLSLGIFILLLYLIPKIGFLKRFF